MPKLTKLLGTAAVVAMMAAGAYAQDSTPSAPAADTAASTPAKKDYRKDVNADTVVATVNGKDITVGQMQIVRDSLPAQYLQMDDATLFKGILDQLVQQTALSELGEGRKTKRDDVALEVQRRAYLAGSMLEYSANRAVSDDAVQKAYDAKYKAADPVTEYHAAHIIVPTKEKAEELKKQLDDGADFAELAKANSQDGAAANGGDLGWFSLDQMVEPFGAAVADMKDGQISEPVQTQYGWHIIKREGSRIADAPKLADVRDELEGDLRQKAVESRVKDTVDAADVKRMDDDIDPAILKNDKLFGQ
ncbi:peptidylprolyl isomerase [Thioclava sp. GXIMD2076]|uniref:peptidylprolyl isomerase n=1 Tax=Thioclava sp. GXIMD2076 TaxID=3131931 RepID=UPI0030D07F5B